jgi:hypothetical protein
MGLASLLILAIAGYRWRREGRLPLSGMMVLSYGAVSICLYLLPRPTNVHHWIVGTPFQYAALALTLGELFQAQPVRKWSHLGLKTAFVCLMGVLLAARGVNLISLEKSMLRGDATTRWHASLTEFGQAAANKGTEAIFVCADWGVATQIYCCSGGESGLIYEPFFDYQGVDQLEETLERSGKDAFYVVGMKPATSVRVENTKRIWRDVEALSSWQEVAVEKELAEAPVVTVRKFRRGGKDVAQTPNAFPALR